MEQTIGRFENKNSLDALRELRKEKNTCHLAAISGEGNGTPLQYSCLENPMDGGAW